jgi:hypothetical protein
MRMILIFSMFLAACGVDDEDREKKTGYLEQMRKGSAVLEKAYREDFEKFDLLHGERSDARIRRFLESGPIAYRPGDGVTEISGLPDLIADSRRRIQGSGLDFQDLSGAIGTTTLMKFHLKIAGAVKSGAWEELINRTLTRLGDNGCFLEDFECFKNFADDLHVIYMDAQREVK